MSITLNWLDMQALAPFSALGALIVAVLMLIAFRRDHLLTFWTSCAGLALCILAINPAWVIADRQVTPLLAIDHFGLFFIRLLLVASLVVCLLARDYLMLRKGRQEEFYLLMLLATFGAIVLVCSTHLAGFMLGLELLGVSLYALIAYPERDQLPLEGGIKYLILSGVASALLLFGFALLYVATGTLYFPEIGAKLPDAYAETSLLVVAGGALILAGVGFKLSQVPFHMWTPDVYQGARWPVTAFLGSVAKAAVFIALVRFYIAAEIYRYPSIVDGLTLVAIASMLIGNLLALLQENVKRLLAYSSIAHFGYLLVALIAGGVIGGSQLAAEASSYYVIAYVLTSLVVFAVFVVLSSTVENDLEQVSDFQGLFWRNPLLALGLTVGLLSLAGMPLTAGFVGKFYLFNAGIAGSLWPLLLALVIGSGIGIYYYLRLVYSLCKPQVEGSDYAAFSFVGRYVVIALLAMVLWLGVYPQPLIEQLRFLVSVVS
jgi:NADH-quinone oxidoreductase subunit N